MNNLKEHPKPELRHQDPQEEKQKQQHYDAQEKIDKSVVVVVTGDQSSSTTTTTTSNADRILGNLNLKSDCSNKDNNSKSSTKTTPTKHKKSAPTFTKTNDKNNNDTINPNTEPKILSLKEESQKQRHGSRRKSSSFAARSRLVILGQIGEDWLYLALLGTIMALLSFSMDSVITLLLNTRLRLFKDVSNNNPFIKYLAWCITPIVLVTFSSGFVHLCSPTAIGSGIPEMKTILRGVVLKEYLTFRTLIAKIVGLTFTLGSGLPLGKEGPFVHMASIVATLLSKLVASFQGIYENESRTSEMLSAACAVGVAATFYAPIGGVLFSIEVTTVYFAVRNYWRGFFAACCGATIWRLLGFWIKNDDYPFDPVELLIFSLIGAICGLAGAAYIKFHREIVQFFRRHKRLSEYFQKHRFVYPIMVTFLITTVTYPPFLGKYTASTLSTHTTIEHLFSNRTWSLGNQDLTSKKILDEWTTSNTSFHIHLVLYIVMLFWTSAVASTIPIPSGIFVPVLKIGGALGRLLGEIMHSMFPDGITYGEYVHSSAIVPGSYAVVGAAAFSGAVTHTISTSVILFEMTGQIVHIIPVILGVLIANAVCQSLQPSIYDSIIEMKKLPYLPPIASSNSVSHKILVKDFMNTKLAYISKEKYTYAQLKRLLIEHKKINSFPLVESQDSMKLLGSIARFDLLKLLYIHLGRERRLQEVNRRNSDVQQPQQNHLILANNFIRPKGARVSNLVQEDSNKLVVAPSVHESLTQNAVDEEDDDENGNVKMIVKQGYDRSEQDKKRSSRPLFSKRLDSNNNNNNPEGDASNSEERRSTSSSICSSSSSSDPNTLTEDTSSSSSSTISTADNGSILGANSSKIILDYNSSNKTINNNKSSPTSSISSGLNIKFKRRRPNVFSNSNGSNRFFFDERKFSSLNDEENDYGSLVNEVTLMSNQQSTTTSDDIKIAKMVNHYNKGSIADEDQLIKNSSSLLVEVDQTDSAQKKSSGETCSVDVLNKRRISQDDPSIEIKEVDKQHKNDATIQDKSDCVAKDNKKDNNNSSHYNFLKRISPTTFGSSNFKSRYFTRPLSPLVELKAASSFNVATSIQNDKNNKTSNDGSNQLKITINDNNNYSTSTINSNISRPKSILKTSSTAENLNNIYMRNISIQSLSNNNESFSNDIRNHQLDNINKQNSPLSDGDKVTFANYHYQANLTMATGCDSSIDFESLSFNNRQNLNKQRRRVRLPKLRVVDMTPEEQERWEAEQLNALVDITKCQFDEAPFQLVQQTSLYRVHTLFSMLGLNHAYVTSYGRLVGIVALKDIRYAIEEMLQE